MPTPTVNIEPMERLADKVKGLIGVLERTRTELSQTIEYNLTLGREVEHLKAQQAMDFGPTESHEITRPIRADAALFAPSIKRPDADPQVAGRLRLRHKLRLNHV